ncbi:MAG: porphobilinogen synthase [Planctomycetota bacterium]|jgi:porphobilinogen synthase
MKPQDTLQASRQRPRRLRRSPLLREMVSETVLSPERLIQPHFALSSAKGTEAISSMPGISRMGREDLVRQVAADLELGLRNVLIFGLANENQKSPLGEQSQASDGAVQRAVEALKTEFGDDLLVITDVCLCAYTDHGHCGVLNEGVIENQPSLPLLANMAVSHASAGADIVAPSDMMDGRVGAIRDGLDAGGFDTTGIMSYSVKYASAYYGPFRDAADSAPGNGDRKSYQMDVRNTREAEREALLDEQEGADMLMVKPALAYLDVIQRVRAVTNLPLAAYNVSGEFSSVKAAAERGWIDEAAVVRENLIAITRAGADIIITYHAREALQGAWL